MVDEVFAVQRYYGRAIHPDDVDMFQEFVSHWNRSELENELPARLKRKGPPIVFHSDDFANRIQDRFLSLSAELRSLYHPPIGFPDRFPQI
jgi:hypothetical protein